MSQTPTSTMETRYLGVDLHKHYVVIGGVNAQQTVVLPPRRAELEVSATERLHVKHDLATLQQVEGQLAEVEAELNRLSVKPALRAAT